MTLSHPLFGYGLVDKLVIKAIVKLLQKYLSFPQLCSFPFTADCRDRTLTHSFTNLLIPFRSQG